MLSHLNGVKMNKEEIQKQIELMTQYAQMMLDRGDWHGVADAAMDIRELLAIQKIKQVDNALKCLKCGKKTKGEDAFCTEKCWKEYSGELR